MKNYFITAIGTDSGKTLISAIAATAYQADYWKPVQAGLPADTDEVRTLLDPRLICHPEQYRLSVPASPHYAAECDHISLQVDKFKLPVTTRNLIIEGAGGILVPLNKNEYVIDLAEHFNAEVILVCDLYLGSINHSLLSLEFLKKKHIPVVGIVFNGPENPSSESIIEAFSPWPVLLKVRREKNINAEVVKNYARMWKKSE